MLGAHKQLSSEPFDVKIRIIVRHIIVRISPKVNFICWRANSFLGVARFTLECNKNSAVIPFVMLGLTKRLGYDRLEG